MREKVEMSWKTAPMPKDTYCAKLLSMSLVSLEKRLMILPMGFTWKKKRGARRTEDSMFSCRVLAAFRLQRAWNEERRREGLCKCG
jgi:hypothetical protein